MHQSTVDKTSILSNKLGMHRFELPHGFLPHTRQQHGRTDAKKKRENGWKQDTKTKVATITAHRVCQRSPVARPVLPRDKETLTSPATRPR
jgi:hypothetical protein